MKSRYPLLTRWHAAPKPYAPPNIGSSRRRGSSSTVNRGNPDTQSTEASSSWLREQEKADLVTQLIVDRITWLKETKEDKIPKDQRNVSRLLLAVRRKDIVVAKKMARSLVREASGVDEAWMKRAVTDKEKNVMVDGLVGPLHLAAQSGYFEMCKMLVSDFKCGVNAPTADGKTPLLYATNQLGNKAIVKYFVDNHADPNKGDSGGITPLHMASCKGSCDIVEYLLSKGANVDPIDQDGHSPLLDAATRGHEEVVTLLLKHNANYNQLSKKLWTPATASIFTDSLECLEVLVKAGADVHATGGCVSPLILAAYRRLDGCTHFLLRNGADPYLPDKYNNIPIQVAAAIGWKEGVEILLSYTPQFAKYVGMNISDIVQVEKAEWLRRSTMAIDHGDVAYWLGEYDLALKHYNEAIYHGHNDLHLYAKMSLCHLYLRETDKYLEDALNYMNMVQPDLFTDSDARSLVRDFYKTWEAPWSCLMEASGSGSMEASGSGSKPTDETDNASREGNP